MEMESEISCVDSLADYAVSLVRCCRCQHLVCDPVTLDCLHTCCRSCLMPGSNREPTQQSSSTVECPDCCEATELSAVTSSTVLRNYVRLSALSSEAVCCSACDGDDAAAAVFWCADCFMGLCVDCYSWHNRFPQRHRSAEVQIARMWPLSQLMPDGQCELHKRRITEQCFTCRRPQCFLCCSPCRADNHELQPLSHGETMKHLIAIIGAIRARRVQVLRLTSGLQKKCQQVRSRLQGELKAGGHKMLVARRRSLSDSTVRTFDRHVLEVCVNLQRIWCMCTNLTTTRPEQSQTAFSAADHIENLASMRLRSLQLHRERNHLKMISHHSMSSMGALLSWQRKYWQENGGFSIDGAVPRTSGVMLRSCLGTVDQRRAAPLDPLLFGQVMVTFRAPVDCLDLAVTRDGHVLLAAKEHGLLVYSSRGQQLSSWRPKRHISGRDDRVYCVAALSDERAAVGVGHARLVVLLKQCKTRDTWLEDRHVAVLHSPPGRLAVHSDLLAAAERIRCLQRQKWVPGRQVKLLSLSSGHLLYTHCREYDIRRVALTALCLLTVSRDPVKRNSGATPYVLDAFSHSGEFLWRHETSDEEGVLGLCVSEDTWSLVYAAVWRRDLRNNRVMAISGSDGKHIREVMSSSTHGLQLPAYLSLASGQQRTVLAVLSRDRAAEQFRTVSLYESTSSSRGH